MKQIGSLDLRGQAKVKDAPTEPTHVMRKQDVEALVSGTSPLYIVNVTPTSSGIVSSKNYVANTIPANQVLEDCIANTYSIRVHVLVEGDSTFYSPTVDVNGTNVVLSEHATDKRLFEGYADLVLSEDGVLTATSSSGAVATSNITFLVGGPVVSSVQVDSLPGVQTAVKHNDVMQISGVVRNDATSVTVANTQAAKGGSLSLGADDSAGAGFKTFTGTAITSNEPNNLSSSLAVYATNFLGTDGDLAYSASGIELDQRLIGFSSFDVTYLASNNAMKGTDTATVQLQIANADVYTYSFADGTVPDVNTYSLTKSVTCTNNSSDNLSNNYKVVATRTANGATGTYNGVVRIANLVANASIAILGNPARLRSSAAGEDYVVRVLSSQAILVAPTLSAPAGGGTFTGSWSSLNGGKEWRRTLNVTDADTVGAHQFFGFSYINEANVEYVELAPEADANYEIGGMTFRSLVVPAFSQVVALGSSVGNINKTTARYAGADEALALRNDTNDVAKAYTITDAGGTYDANGTYLFINDVAFAGSNTSGTLVIEFEEIV